MADTGKCDIALFGGPYVVVDTSTVDLGACDIALFGGPPIAYVTSTTQTQEESMSGGAVTGNSADKVAIRVEAGSTGAVSGGEAAKTATLIGEEVGVGGSVVGGTAGIVLTLALSASAGAVAGDSAEAVVVTVVAGSGGAVASSTLNPLALIAEVVADGGAEAGSSASLLVLRGADCSGGSVAGDAGALEVLVVREASAGGVANGTSNEWLHYAVHVVEAAGGSVGAGSSVAVASIEFIPSAGAEVGGSPSYLYVGDFDTGGGGVSRGEVTFEWADDLPDDEQLPCDNIRQIVRAAATGMSLRLRLAGSSVAPVTIDGASWGERSGVTADFVDLPTRLTFGGSDSVTIPAGGTVYTDWVVSPVIKNRYYLFHLSLAEADSWMKIKPTGTVKEYYKLSGTDDTMVQYVSGYSTSSNITAVISVEIASSLTVSYAGSEGALAGGSADVEFVKEYGVSAGAVVGATASYMSYIETQLLASSSIGGAIVGDSAIAIKIVDILADAGAGAVAGGSATLYIANSGYASAGGAVVAGTYSWLQTMIYGAFQGSVAGGFAGTEISGDGSYTGVGGAISGGSASLNRLLIQLATGGSIAGYEGLYQFSVPSVSKTVPYSRGYWGINKASNPIWDFTEQKNKWGYLNNPNWTSTPSAPVNYDGREDEEPQIWTVEGDEE